MAKLRDPDGGCPWDLEQDFSSIAPYTIEEAYEVADAIQRADMADLKDELGDLLLQVVFHAQMADEARLFRFADVVAAVCEKMIRRHPHVFGTAHIDSAEGQTVSWEAIKAAERAEKAKGDASLLDDVPVALPALLRAVKLQKRAARARFDWNDPVRVFDKVEEELAELREAVASGDAAHVAEEMGDLLFVMANLARHLKVDPEDALRQANAKFVRRFHYIEQNADTPDLVAEPLSLEALEALWQEAKAKGL
ncbi:nucleoside triphosphate pyrophosphohydrolase [Hyphomicrobiales bacterium FT118]|uniref:Nucleoside triphosphate pyrophosphohydrolase n=2 Tax=Futiania mangrovi TaxID=2959716 RepID=A0A9J6P879_9PROT|nr:nucleoside triphosphate pyrophosphohydrolase [Futiania mangrovii]